MSNIQGRYDIVSVLPSSNITCPIQCMTLARLHNTSVCTADHLFTIHLVLKWWKRGPAACAAWNIDIPRQQIVYIDFCLNGSQCYKAYLPLSQCLRKKVSLSQIHVAFAAVATAFHCERFCARENVSDIEKWPLLFFTTNSGNVH